jgi:glycosyltransferase involved in cell wall biosynthesis
VIDVNGQEERPLISVVMPVYNSETFLAEAIESILKQTLGDFELLIVYDESGDGSLAIIDRYRKLDPRIRVIQGQRKALIGALNQGIDAAKGKYIARMDADDLSHPNRFEKQVETMESGADICGCHWLMINEAGKLVEAKLVPLCHDAFTIFLACEVPFAHGSVMMRTEFLERHALRYGGSLIEDYDLWIRFFEKGAKFANVDDFLFKWRDLDYSLTRKLTKVAASKNKGLRRRFVRGNSDACLRAVQELTKRYSSLSQPERVCLLLASCLVSMVSRKPAFWNVVRRSSGKSIGLALLYLVRGV